MNGEAHSERDFQSSDFDLIPPDPKRGGCLSLWLVGVIGFNLVGIFLLITEGALDCIGLGLSLANIVCAAAVWQLKRWGVYGLASSFGLTIVLGVLSQSLHVTASGIVPMTILFVLVHRIWHDLEPTGVLS